MKLVIASGHFNPIHNGHISYLEEAKKLGDELLVIISSDYQVRLKGNKEFLNENERQTIVGALRAVNYTMISASKDGSTSADFYTIRKDYPKDKLFFAKGGDRTIDNIPQSEIKACKDNNIEMIFNVGCEKVQSSRDIRGKIL